MPTLSMSSSLTTPRPEQSITQAESISGRLPKLSYVGIWAFLNWCVRFAHGFLSQSGFFTCCLLCCVLLVYFGEMFCLKLIKEASLCISLKGDDGESKYNLASE